MGRCLIVTGGSRGIGAATVRLAARQGWDVCLSYVRDGDAAAAVVGDIEAAGGRAMAVQCDVGRDDGIAPLFDAAEAAFGPVAGLVNNAGITGGFAKVSELTGALVREVFDVNVVGTMLCSAEAVRRMSTAHGGAGGVIVNISSTATKAGSPGEWVHYAASKGAVDVFTGGLAREVAREGIRVNAVAPGLILTDLHASVGDPDRPNRMADQMPIGRAATPEEVAEAVVWLLSDAASYVAGAVLPVAGGR